MEGMGRALSTVQVQVGQGIMKCARGCMGVHEAEHEEMKCAQGCTGVHGVAWVSATWVMMHDARGAHGGPGHQCGSRVTQVTGACDHIRFRARCRARQGRHVRRDMGMHGGGRRCMEVYGGAWGINTISLSPALPPVPLGSAST
jgi:hypothetical protein